MATTGFDEVVWYHTAGSTGDLPAVILVGYDTNGDGTTTIGDVTDADLLVLGLANVKLSMVPAGSAAGQWEVGNAVSAG